MTEKVSNANMDLHIPQLLRDHSNNNNKLEEEEEVEEELADESEKTATSKKAEDEEQLTLAATAKSEEDSRKEEQENRLRNIISLRRSVCKKPPLIDSDDNQEGEEQNEGWDDNPANDDDDEEEDDDDDDGDLLFQAFTRGRAANRRKSTNQIGMGDLSESGRSCSSRRRVGLSRSRSRSRSRSKSKRNSKFTSKRKSLLDDLPGLTDKNRTHKIIFWDDTTISTCSSGITHNSRFNPCIIYGDTGDMEGDSEGKQDSKRQLFRSNSDRALQHTNDNDQAGDGGLVATSLHDRRSLLQRSSAYKQLLIRDLRANQIVANRSKRNLLQRTNSQRRALLQADQQKALDVDKLNDGLQDNQIVANRSKRNLFQRTNSQRRGFLLADQQTRQKQMEDKANEALASANTSTRRRTLLQRSLSDRRIYAQDRRSLLLTQRSSSDRNLLKNPVSTQQQNTPTKNDGIIISKHGRSFLQSPITDEGIDLTSSGMANGNQASTRRTNLAEVTTPELNRDKQSGQLDPLQKGSAHARLNALAKRQSVGARSSLLGGRGSAHSRLERSSFKQSTNSSSSLLGHGMRRCNTVGGGLDRSSRIGGPTDQELPGRASMNATFSKLGGDGEGSSHRRFSQSLTLSLDNRKSAMEDNAKIINNRYSQMRRCMSGDSIGMMYSSLGGRMVHTRSGTNLSHVEASLRNLEASLSSNIVNQDFALRKVQASLQDIQASLSSDGVSSQGGAAMRRSVSIDSCGMLGCRPHARCPTSSNVNHFFQTPNVRNNTEVGNNGRQSRSSRSKRVLGLDRNPSGGLADSSLPRSKTSESVRRRSSSRTSISRSKTSGSDASGGRLNTCEGGDMKRVGSGTSLHSRRLSFHRAKLDGRGSTKKKNDSFPNQESTTVRRVKSAQDALQGLDDDSETDTDVRNFSYSVETTVTQRLVRSNSNPEAPNCEPSEVVPSVNQDNSTALRRTKTGGDCGEGQKNTRPKCRSASNLLGGNEEPAVQTRRRSRSKHRRSSELPLTDDVGARQNQKHSRPKRRSSSKLQLDDVEAVEQRQKHSKGKRRSSSRLQLDDEPKEERQKQSRSRQRQSLKSRVGEDELQKRSSHKRRGAKKERAKRTTSEKSTDEPKSDHHAEGKKKHPSSPDLRGLSQRNKQSQEKEKSKQKDEKELSLDELVSYAKAKTRSDSHSRWKQLDASRTKLALDTFAKASNHSCSSAWGENSASHSISGDSFGSEDFSIPTIVSGKHEDGSKKSRPSVQCIKRQAAASVLKGDASSSNGVADSEATLKAQRLLQLQKTWKAATSQLVDTGT